MSEDKQLVRQDLSAVVMESVLLSGDLSKLTPSDRVRFYQAVCESLKLNPLTKPFEYINLNGKLRLYATKDCTEQLRHTRSISITIVSREVVEDVYVVTARAEDAAGRTDESIGAVPLGQLKGEARSNAMMKAETKAKRRVTLSICGLGMVDASETDSIPTARRVKVDDAGEIKGELPAGDIPDGGSREAQQEVLNRKLAEIEKEDAAKPKKAVKADSGNWFKTMLEGFTEMKTQIPDQDYYRILGNNGYEHANQIPDRKTAMAIYKEMAEVRKALQDGETLVSDGDADAILAAKGLE